MDPAPDPSAETTAQARAAARAERRLAMLDELAEISLEVVRELRGELLAAGCVRPDEGAPGQPTPARKRSLSDLVLAFHRATRALRLTLALQEQLEKAQGAPAGADASVSHRLKVVFVDSVAGVESEPYESGADRPPFEAADARRLQVGRTVRDQARASLAPGEYSPREAADWIERIGREAETRLQTEREFEDIMARPLSEIIDAICRDLGVAPDWALLADEPWARFEMAAGPVGAPLAPFRPPERERSSRPLRPPDTWPSSAGPS